MHLSEGAVSAGRRFEKICDIVDSLGREPSKLIPILQAVQDEYRYLPGEVLTYVAVSLGLSPSKVYGVATFYTHFALEPKGRHVIRLCDGTACHVRDSLPILDALRSTLGLSGTKTTTSDMAFTVETVACLGACGLAPVVVVDDIVHGTMTPAAAVGLVDEIRRVESETKS
ncbi:MAG: NAD(P)H-dependent oxidoreductase subunit E [Polyangiaceae bacterium]|jgi:NADH-quinone oxidoreductase subunit E